MIFNMKKIEIVGMLFVLIISLIIMWGSIFYIMGSENLGLNIFLTCLTAYWAYKETAINYLYMARVSFIWTMILGVKYYF